MQLDIQNYLHNQHLLTDLRDLITDLWRESINRFIFQTGIEKKSVDLPSFCRIESRI